MSLAVLRRRVRTEPIPVEPVAPVQESLPASPVLPSPPSYRPGLCWHKAHVCLDGERYGVTPLARAGAAAITRCEHLSRTGR